MTRPFGRMKASGPLAIPVFGNRTVQFVGNTSPERGMLMVWRVSVLLLAALCRTIGLTVREKLEAAGKHM